MIILEGPDGSGKSTLAELIETWLNITREPRAVSAGAEKLKPIGQFVVDELKRGFGLRLYDRFALLSAPMYLSLPNPTFSEELLDIDFLSGQWRKFVQLDPLVIMCLPPLDTVRDNIAADKSSQVVWPHVDTIYWSYHNQLAMLKSMNVSVLHYDYTREGPFRVTQEKALDNNLRWVKARIEREEREKMEQERINDR